MPMQIWPTKTELEEMGFPPGDERYTFAEIQERLNRPIRRRLPKRVIQKPKPAPTNPQGLNKPPNQKG